MNTKKCARCDEVKESNKFKPDLKAKSGLNSWCMECWKVYKNTHVPGLSPSKRNTQEGRKQCRKCTEQKLFIDFSKNDKIKSGLHSWCKNCVKEYSKKRLGPPKEPKEKWPDGHKACTTCKELKPATLEFFKIHKEGRLSLSAKCSPCFLADQRARRERDKDKINARNRERVTRKATHEKKSCTRWLVDGKEPTHKLCKGPCGLNKHVTEYRVKFLKKTGHPSYDSKCKTCISNYQKEYKLKYPDRHKAKLEKRLLKSKAATAARRALAPKPKKGHFWCIECKRQKPHTSEFFEVVKHNDEGLNSRCRKCSTKRKQKRTKRRLSDKFEHRFCNHCFKEFHFELFKTESGTIGYVCQVCRIASEKTNREKMLNDVRSRLRTLLHGRSKKMNPEIGCNSVELRKYIETVFEPGMTWENYGTYWHLDHHYPLSKAYEHGPKVFAKAKLYTNIRPVEAHKNLTKHCTVPAEYIDINVFLNS